MKPLYKKGFALAIILPILILIGVWTGIKITDFNQYKANVEQQFFEQMGHKLQINGEILVNPFPFKISLTDLLIENKKGFSTDTFAKVSAIHVSLSSWQLFVHQKVVIEELFIEKADLFLETNPQQDSNWKAFQNLAKLASQPHWKLGHLLLKNSRIHWQNTEGLQRWDLTNFNLTAVNLSANQRFHFITDFKFTTLQNETIYVAELASQLQVNQALNHFQFADWHGVLRIVLPASYNLAETHLKTHGTALDLNLKHQSLSVLNAQFNSKKGKFTTSFDVIFSSDFLSNGNLIGTEINLKEWFKYFNISLPDTVKNPLFTPAYVELNWQQNAERLVINNIVLNWAESLLKGQLIVNESSKIDFNIQVNKVNLDNYLPFALPVKFLRKRQLEGRFKIGQLQVWGMTFSELDTRLFSTGGRIQLAPFDSKLYGGSLSSKLSLDITGNTPSFQWLGKVKQVNLKPFLSDGWQYELMTGKYTGQFRLASQGTRRQDWKKNMQGNFSANIQAGSYQGKSLYKTLLNKKSLPEDSTSFDSLTLTGKIDKGIFKAKKMNIKASKFTAIGTGTYDIYQNKINANLYTQFQDLRNENPIKIQGKASKASWK